MSQAADLRVTVDVIVFTILEGALKVLLVRRDRRPFRGRWAIPGGFVEPDEPLADAALRELAEETGLKGVYLEQLYTFGDPGRDPRGRTITVAYLALVNSARFEAATCRPRGTARAGLQAGSDAAAVAWLAAYDLPALAFDHNRILAYALERLRNKLFYTTVGFELLPREFTLSHLQEVYEILLNRRQDKRNFRRKILSLDILEALAKARREGRHRPARLYRFRKPRWTYLRERAFVTG